MKKYVITLIIVSLCKIINAGNLKSDMYDNTDSKRNATIEQSSESFNSSNGTAIINSGDTLVFDLSRAIISGNHIEFPVRILSDDIIYSVDFSFKYNHTNLVYDSITNLTNYIQPLSFYNATDSTLRFTSSSLSSYQNDSALVSVHFTLMGSQIHPSDLINVKAYLNGDKCSVKVINPTVTGLNDLQQSLQGITIYPNPAVSTLTVESPVNAKLQFMDMKGRNLFMTYQLYANQSELLDVSVLKNGMYLVKIITEQGEIVKKVIVEN